MTGDTPSYPVKMKKPCWPDFARRMLTHPGVRLKDLNTLSFRNAGDFHTLSYYHGSKYKWQENLRRSGQRVFGDASERTIKKEHYEQETFPYWEWIKVGNDYWKARWHVFKKIMLDYYGTFETDYKTLNRPNNEDVAKQIARAHGMRLGGRGYGFASNWRRKGLYGYFSGYWANIAFFGRYGSNSQARINGARLDNNVGIQVLKFNKHSRFYNALPVTKNMNQALNNHKFLEIRENGHNYRYLIAQTYHRDGFPFYNFLVLAAKN